MSFVHISVPDQHRVTDANGRTWDFEISHGVPWPLTKKGEPFRRCGPKNPFWTFINDWLTKQRATDGNFRDHVGDSSS